MTASRRRGRATALAGAVVGVVMVALAGVAVVHLFGPAPDDAREADSVRQVADLSVVVTEALDVAAGLELLCEPPMDLYRMTVEATVVRWQNLSGSDRPAVRAEVSDVDAGASGSFLLRIRGDEEGIGDERQAFRVFVDSRGGRSCVTGVGGVDSSRQTTRFGSGGYSSVTSPSPGAP